jgi:hypothetical protein
MRSEAMDHAPLGPPANDRIEHRVDDLSPLILGFYDSMPAAFSAMTLAVRRLRERGEDGWVVLIHHEVKPEVELARRKVRPREPIIRDDIS